MLGRVGGESVERYCRLASCDCSSPIPAVPSRTTGERSGDSAGDAFAVVIPLQSFSWSDASCSIVGVVVSARWAGIDTAQSTNTIWLQNVDWGDGLAVATESTAGLLCTRTTGSCSVISIFGGEQGAEEGVGHREEGGAVAMLSQFIDFATSMFLFFFYMAFQYTGIVSGSGFRFLTLFLPLPGDQLQARVPPPVCP
ncbi:uncharacterized protein LOC110434195 isoform X2 [Sorghum bicolor]|nr:uncharacterized protein LOC110434195 isoform X2 [Sorghum bicolor]|eukprot:XP_021313669.1 uncharacterized protein LOC110434195 isoform X2 [Sorghum bicolor]